MNHWNLSNLDLGCKRSLEMLLRPAYYTAIMPWMAVADDATKRHVVRTAELAFSKPGKDEKSHWNVDLKFESGPRRPQSARVTANPYRLARADCDPHKAIDRFAHEKGECRPQSARRQHEGTDTPRKGHSNAQVAEAYSWMIKPLHTQPFSKLLAPDALRGLEKWQAEGGAATGKQTEEEKARMVRGLHSLAEMLRKLPDYRRDELAPRRPRGKPTAAKLRQLGLPSELDPGPPPRRPHRPQSAPNRLYAQHRYGKQVALMCADERAGIPTGLRDPPPSWAMPRPLDTYDPYVSERDMIAAKHKQTHIAFRQTGAYVPASEYTASFKSHGAETQKAWDWDKRGQRGA